MRLSSPFIMLRPFELKSLKLYECCLSLNKETKKEGSWINNKRASKQTNESKQALL